MPRPSASRRKQPVPAPPSGPAGPDRLAAVGRWAGHWSFPVALAVLHLVLSLLALRPQPYVGGDNGTYVSLARALLERGAYVEAWDPALPPHTQYPPVFPAVLALGMATGLRAWVGLKLLCVAFSAAAVAFSALWLRRVTTPGTAAAVGLLLAITPGVLEQNHLVLSDVPAWSFTALALWAFARGNSAEGGAERGTRWLALGAAAAVLAYFTRSAGLPLVVAALLWMAWRRRWRGVAALAGIFLPLAALWWMRGRAAGSAGYVGQFWMADPYQPARGTIGPLDLFARVAENGGKYLSEHLPLLLFSGDLLPMVLLGGAVATLAVAGWARRLRMAGVAEVWFPLYSGLVLVWPATWSGERFLLPLLPLLLLYAGEVLRDAGARVGRGRVRAAGTVAAVVLGAGMLPGVAMQVRGGKECRARYAGGDSFPCTDPVWADLFRVAEGVRGRLPEGSVVLARKPTLFFALSGYPSLAYPLSAEPDSFFAAARRAGAGFVVVDQSPDIAPLYLHPILLARRDDFCVVPELSLPNAALARIDTAGPPRDPGAPENAFRSCPLTPSTADDANP